MLYTICHMLYAICYILSALSDLQYAVWYMLHTICIMPYLTCYVLCPCMLYAAGYMPYSACCWACAIYYRLCTVYCSRLDPSLPICMYIHTRTYIYTHTMLHDGPHTGVSKNQGGQSCAQIVGLHYKDTNQKALQFIRGLKLTLKFDLQEPQNFGLFRPPAGFWKILARDANQRCGKLPVCRTSCDIGSKRHP